MPTKNTTPRKGSTAARLGTLESGMETILTLLATLVPATATPNERKPAPSSAKPKATKMPYGMRCTPVMLQYLRATHGKRWYKDFGSKTVEGQLRRMEAYEAVHINGWKPSKKSATKATATPDVSEVEVRLQAILAQYPV